MTWSPIWVVRSRPPSGFERIVLDLTVDGHHVYAATGGRPHSPELETVVFVHGAGGDHTVWVLPSRYFARHRRNVLAVDLPGHGRSDGEALDSVEAMADWLVKVLDAAAIESAAIVGHSLGSLVALETASRYPERVRAVALIGTSVPMPVGKPLLDSAETDDHAALDMLNLWGHSRAAHLGGNATPGMWMLGAGMRLLERARPGVIHRDLDACNRYAAGLDHAAGVRCPALLILGERDAMAPARNAADVAKAIPEAETVILEGAGHALMAECPDPMLDQLIRIV